MAKVFSFRTGAQLDKQGNKANDLLAAGGQYLGKLKLEDAKSMRSLQTELVCKQEQLNELINDFDLSFREYLENVINALIFLRVDYTSFNAETDKLMVNEEGHVWLVKK